MSADDLAAPLSYVRVNRLDGHETPMTEAEAFAYLRTIHAGRSCTCKHCAKSTPECEWAGIRKVS